MPITGTLLSVSGSEVTIETKAGKPPSVVTVGGAAEITVNGKKAYRSSLQNGDTVTVFGPANDVTKLVATRS